MFIEYGLWSDGYSSDAVNGLAVQERENLPVGAILAAGESKMNFNFLLTNFQNKNKNKIL